MEALSHLRGELALAALLDAAGAPEADLRRAALIGLGLGGHPASLPILLEAAGSADVATRLVAVSALARFSDAEALPALGRAAVDADEGVRVAAIGFLAARPTLAATEALIDLLRAGAHPERVLAALAHASDERVAGVLSALRTADDALSARLAYALARMGRARARWPRSAWRSACPNPSRAQGRGALPRRSGTPAALVALRARARRRSGPRGPPDLLAGRARPVSTAVLPLRPQVFAILSALVEERSGLHFELSHLDQIADKLSARAIDAGFESLLDYYYYLRYDDASGSELSALLDTLVVNETYFFRELESLKRIVSDFIAPLAASGQHPRVWCAACATGEEPFTLAMLLADRGVLGDVEIVASDISRRALARAQAGEFKAWSLRQIPPGGLDERWLVKVDGQIRVREELRGAIRWRRVNLVDNDDVAALGVFDVIICRNVLIYFRNETVARVLGRLSASLRPAGVLLVGVSESLLRFGTALACEERGGTFFYRKEP